jgi:hypothetical protein
MGQNLAIPLSTFPDAILKTENSFQSLFTVYVTALKVTQNIQGDSKRAEQSHAKLRKHHVTRHNTSIHNILSTAPQLRISQKALGTLPEDDNVMPKHVGATIHN